MNQIIDTIMNHRSIRKFEEKALSEDQIRTIVESAQAASTSSFIQAYSIIGVKDKGRKQQLAEIAGNQTYVAENGHFFVFCADLHRHQVLSQMENRDITTSLQSTEKFMVAVIDAALAAQNAVIAAESMGLGACYIGGLRNNLEDVCQVLKVPERVIPLFGIAVGYPDQEPGKKPRLPYEHVYHEDEYQQDEKVYVKQLQEYNKIISEYYLERTDGKRSDTWTEQMVNMLEKPKRMYMKEFVKKQGYDLE
ncbi:oxygen-insensitive NADPH nitroreductase [Fredinandcohnia sp. 179-A 10B2 NHS]|uniref:oxygen-insensitive NADPH nitroreductase n=1 Tax=Fredinandcohnia sp. 179-A 10B2 NHS TaxID=3235176 RepID=UPI0039A3DDB0